LENQPAKNLLKRLIRWGVIGQIVLGLFLLVPGTLHYWQGWTFMAVNAVVTIIFCTYYYRRDRELLARRMLRKEKIVAQRIIMFLTKEIAVVLYIVCGFDNRFGWSQTYFMPVPWWLTVLALLGYAGCYFLFIPVLNANRFAASIIQIETGQTVADTGPYHLVRHPMYAVSIVLWFLMPPALGSFVALPLTVLIIPMLIWRLLNEEKMLRRDLPGYAEYCQRTRYRLIPPVW
jgi:protein-S-isoprenylcysteine O-methyltransferase Ste14